MRQALITFTAMLLTVAMPARADLPGESGGNGSPGAARHANADEPTRAALQDNGTVAAGSFAIGNRLTDYARKKSVPEPRTLFLLGIGLIAIGCMKRRK